MVNEIKENGGTNNHMRFDAGEDIEINTTDVSDTLGSYWPISGKIRIYLKAISYWQTRKIESEIESERSHNDRYNDRYEMPYTHSVRSSHRSKRIGYLGTGSEMEGVEMSGDMSGGRMERILSEEINDQIIDTVLHELTHKYSGANHPRDYPESKGYDGIPGSEEGIQYYLKTKYNIISYTQYNFRNALKKVITYCNRRYDTSGIPSLKHH